MHFTRERALTLAASTAAFGLSALLRKVAVDRLHPLQYQVVTALVYTTLIPLYVFLAFKHGGGTEGATWKGVGIAVSATVVASFGGVMFGFALRSGNDAGVVSALSSLSPIITMMLSFFLLGERPSFLSALGCALVLAGVALISYRG